MVESLLPTVIALDHAARIKPVYPAKYEAFRREGLSRLALSLLMRHIVGADDPVGGEMELGDGQAFGYGNLLPEPAYENDNGVPIDLRVHLLPDLADEALRPYRGKEPAKVWYRSNNLYVRRVMPAEPSEAFAVDVAVDVAAKGIEVDFSQLQTLYPYLASRV